MLLIRFPPTIKQLTCLLLVPANNARLSLLSVVQTFGLISTFCLDGILLLSCVICFDKVRTTRQRSKRTNRKRTNPVPEWKKLELVIAEIQKEIARDAVVKHNDKIRGKMVEGRPGKIRKLDVSIRKKIGTAEVLIAIDAKHHTRPVDRGLVAKFAEQVEDVNAHGIMISDSGFDGGARDVAHTKNILLQTYREAQEIDWKILVNSWLTFFNQRAEGLEVYVTLDNDPTQYQLKRNRYSDF